MKTVIHCQSLAITGELAEPAAGWIAQQMDTLYLLYSAALYTKFNYDAAAADIIKTAEQLFAVRIEVNPFES